MKQKNDDIPDLREMIEEPKQEFFYDFLYVCVNGETQPLILE